MHSHTQHSRESLEFIPRYSRRVPILSQLVAHQERRYRRIHGSCLDFADAWWTPPCSARQAYELEQRQIHDRLGVEAMVSLSDHDNIEAASLLQVTPEFRNAPISVEWTVPYGSSFFHLGIHNLPSETANDVLAQLNQFTETPDDQSVPGLLAMLHGFPSVLIILNHPLWDEPGIGSTAHQALVTRFIKDHIQWLHAFELNGLRSQEENRNVAKLAAMWSMPLISGGDRHAIEPNAVLNLTNASNFAEFVTEVREDKCSHILFMDQYDEPNRWRLMQNLLDVVRDYPHHVEGRRRWTDRVFFRSAAGIVKPLSSVWKEDGPVVVRAFMASVRLLESRSVRETLRATMTWGSGREFRSTDEKGLRSARET